MNKLKILFIAVCCLVSVLWSGAQSMDPPQRQNDEPARNHQTELLPAGSIMAFAGEIAPHGWLICHGQQCSSREYPELYKAIKIKFVPSDEEIRILRNNADEDNIYKLFYVPDLRGRVVVGVDGGVGRVTSSNILGESGGQENVTLAINHIPVHDHVVKCSPQTQLGGHYPGDILVPDGTPRSTHNRNTASAGGGQPHNNMQPYTCLNYIINTGQANGHQQNEILQLRKKVNQLEVSQQGCAKAWVNFNKDGTINNSHNVTSVILNPSTYGGDFTVNFTIPFSSTNYCCIGTAATSNYSIMTVFQDPNFRTTSSARFATVNNLFLRCPPDFVNIVAFGEQ